MAGFFDYLLGGNDILSNWFKTGYGIYQDQRDTAYQRELQERIFEREDTAVQRRVADLEAAGLNKNLAAGSAAGAGGIVGRSTGQNIPISGGALDTLSALQQIKQQRTESDILKERLEQERTNTRAAKDYASIAHSSAIKAQHEATLAGWDALFAPQNYQLREKQIGLFDTQLQMANRDNQRDAILFALQSGEALYKLGVQGLEFRPDTWKWHRNDDSTPISAENMPLIRALSAALSSSEAGADIAAANLSLLNKDLSWYNKRAWESLITGYTNSAANVVNSIFGGVDLFAPKYDSYDEKTGSYSSWNRHSKTQDSSKSTVRKHSRFVP